MKNMSKRCHSSSSKLVSVILLLLISGISNLLSQISENPVADKLEGYVKFLASDELEGRFPATAGNLKAGEFIINQLKSFGVQPINGNYQQSFPFTAGLLLGKSNNLELEVIVEKIGIPHELLKPITRKWILGEDWKPIRFSDNGTVKGELLFAGYGVTAPEIKYDDYAGIDVKGKIVIVLTDSAEGKPKIKEFENYSDLKYKATNAREHGAKAVIFVKMQSDSANTFYPFKVDRLFQNSGIITIQANRTSIAKIFPKAKQMLDYEKKINKEKAPQSFLIPDTKMNITVEINEDKKDIFNVVGIVPGTDPMLKDEYIVMGAHYDHLGWGDYASGYHGKVPMIHNGADDNASGVAGMMELASRIAAHPLKRSVIFMSFNAEEEGLLGSSYYVKHPLIPLEKTVFMLNFDMIGRLRENKIDIIGTGSSSAFARIADSLALADSITIAKVNEAFAPSDHASFYANNIPSIMLFTGVHTDYHKPSDKWDKLNYAGEAHLLTFAESYLRTVGDAAVKPDLIKNPEYDSTVKKEKTAGHGAWLGIIPNFESNPLGFRISGTSSGGPAQKVGMQNDDIIIKIGDNVVRNFYDLNNILKQHFPGDVVKVVVLRKDKEKTFEVTLGKRD